jgi:hypothetical protein
MCSVGKLVLQLLAAAVVGIWAGWTTAIKVMGKTLITVQLDHTQEGEANAWDVYQPELRRN